MCLDRDADMAVGALAVCPPERLQFMTRQLVSRVREAFDVDLTLAEVFEEPTVEAIAAVVAAAGGIEGEEDYDEFEL